MKSPTSVFALLFSLMSLELSAQNGDLDITFGSSGIATSEAFMTTRGMAVQPDGQIVLAGNLFAGVSKMQVSKYSASGQLVNAFGISGRVYFGESPYDHYATGIALQPDGKMLLAGSSLLGPNGDFIAVRLLETGELDNTFNGTGSLKVDFAGAKDYVYGLALQSDGKILLIGETQTSAGWPYAIIRLNPDGTLDPLFGADGKVQHVFQGNTVGRARTVAIQPDGKILIAGWAGGKLAMLRLNPDGATDATFGSNGEVISAYGEWTCMVLQPNGRILVAGKSSDGYFQMARFSSNGSPDGTFGVNGVSTLDVSGGATAITLQPDGRILLAGASNGDITLLKCDPDGSLHAAFGTVGVVTTEIGTSTSNSAAVQYLNGQKILLGGTRIGSPNYPIITRYHTSLDSAFTVAVAEPLPENQALAVYPNPALKEISVQYKLSTATPVTLQLLDSEGRVVQTFLTSAWENAGVKTHRFELKPGLPKGVYTVVVNNGLMYARIMVL